MVTLFQEREDHLAREARGLPCHGQRALLQTFSAPVAARRTDGGCRGSAQGNDGKNGCEKWWGWKMRFWMCCNSFWDRSCWIYTSESEWYRMIINNYIRCLGLKWEIWEDKHVYTIDFYLWLESHDLCTTPVSNAKHSLIEFGIYQFEWCMFDCL